MLYGLSEEEKFVYSFTQRSAVRDQYRAVNSMKESHLLVQSPGNVLIWTCLSLLLKGINLPRLIRMMVPDGEYGWKAVQICKLVLT